MFRCQQVLIKPDSELKAIREFVCGESNKLHNCGTYLAKQLYFKTGKIPSKCNVFLWYREGENLRHGKLYLVKGERMTQVYTLLDTVRPFCDKDYQIMEWGGDYAYGDRTPTLLKL